MNFDAFDRRMRQYETIHDQCALPGLYLVARLDGRNFTRLTRERQNFEAPFDNRFRDLMVGTTLHLMDCGFNVVYGYTESDEISLALHPSEMSFGRKLRKLNSVLAGEASGKFSLLLGALGAFDCRISELPTLSLVVDYFRWRQEDAARNALNGHCYWLLRRQGLGKTEATQQLVGMKNGQKHDLLMAAQINFNDLPAWQKRGVGIYRVSAVKLGTDPRNEEIVESTRNVLKVDMELPIGEAYGPFIEARLMGDSG